MRLALSGKSGTVVGLDYRGVRVLAAHEPVAELDLGIVAKIDLSEIRAPFVKAGLLALLGNIVTLLVGTHLFLRMTRPITRRIERRKAEVEALLAASRAILETNDFPKTARAIFDECKALVGARAGYVALLSEDGRENDLLFLDPGGLPCSVDPDLPMPVRGLRADAYDRREVVYENDFAQSGHAKYLPDEHAPLRNVLFAPLILDGKAIGLMGLANKQGGFTAEDARIAGAFAELAAIALRNSRTLSLLEESNRFNETMLQTIPMGISVVDREANVLWTDDRLRAKLGSEAVGQRCYRLYRDDGKRCDCCPLLAGNLENGRTLRTEVDGVFGGRFVEIHHTGFLFKGREAILEVLVDITDRKRAERHREDLLRLVSHDLRTPLAALQGYAGLLAEARRRPGMKLPPVDELIQKIQRNADRMQAMISDLVDVTQIESGQVPTEKRRVNLHDHLRELVAELGDAIGPQRIRIEAPEEPIEVEAGPELLSRIVTNLLGNAMKYSPPDEVVRLALTAQEGHAVVSVSDRGPGIAEEHLPLLFRKFNRLENDYGKSGLGLGLYIARLFVEAHGGRIWAESEPGEGSTFRFTIPL